VPPFLSPSTARSEASNILSVLNARASRVHLGGKGGVGEGGLSRKNRLTISPPIQRTFLLHIGKIDSILIIEKDLPLLDRRSITWGKIPGASNLAVLGMVGI